MFASTMGERLQNPESGHHMLYSLENQRSSQLRIFPEEVYELSFLHLSLSGMLQEFRPVILKGTPIQIDQEVIILST